LLDIDQNKSNDYVNATRKNGDTVKPGWARLAFSCYFSPAAVECIIEAVQWVALHGEELLWQYTFDPKSTMWVHSNHSQHHAQHLWNLDTFTPTRSHIPRPNTISSSFCEKRTTWWKDNTSSFLGCACISLNIVTLPAPSEKLRWFLCCRVKLRPVESIYEGRTSRSRRNDFMSRTDMKIMNLFTIKKEGLHDQEQIMNLFTINKERLHNQEQSRRNDFTIKKERIHDQEQIIMNLFTIMNQFTIMKELHDHEQKIMNRFTIMKERIKALVLLPGT